MIRINLLPVRVEKRKENVRKHVVLFICYVIFLLVVVAGMHMTMTSRVASVKKRIKTQETNISKLEAKIKEVEGYKEKLRDLAEKVTVVVGLELKQRGPAITFRALADLCPKNIWIERVTDKRGKLAIDGFAIDQQTISSFMKRLDADRTFKNVELIKTSIINKAGVTLQNFTLEAVVVLPGMVEPQGDGKAG